MEWKNKVFIKLKNEEDTEYIDISTYGVAFIKGAYDKLLEYPAPKSLLQWDDRRNHGVDYIADNDTIRYDKKSVTINLLMVGSSETDCFSKYEEFMAKITQGVIYLKVILLNRIFKLVYNRVSNIERLDEKSRKFALTMIELNPADRS